MVNTMFLYLAVDDRTIKRTWTWDFNGCKECEFRFECFTDDRVHISPVRVDVSPEFDTWRTRERYKAEFHLPKCLRLGLFKQIADTGYWGQSYDNMWGGDGFKLGGIFKDEEDSISIERSWVKFPNILYVTGHVR